MGGHARAYVLVLFAAIACAFGAATAFGAGGDTSFSACYGAVSGCTATNPAGAIQQPAFVAVSPDSKNVYVASQGSNALSSFSRDPSTGALTMTGCLGQESGCTATTPPDAIDTPDAIAISPDGTSVYIVNSAASVLSLFSRNTTTGALSFTSCWGPLSGCTAISPAGALEDPFTVAVSPDGRNVYVAPDLQALDVFSRNASTGSLSFTGCLGAYSGCTAVSPADAIDGVYSLAFTPDGGSLYAASYNSGPSVLDQFSRNTSTGALALESCVGGLSGCSSTGVPFGVTDYVRAVAVSPDGYNVYTGTDNSALATWSRNSSTGALTYVSCIGGYFSEPCTTTDPTDMVDLTPQIAVTADGEGVYAASQDAGLVELSRNWGATGALTLNNCFGSTSPCLSPTPPDVLDGVFSVATSPGGTSVYATSFQQALSVLSRQVPSIGCHDTSAQTAYTTPVSVYFYCTTGAQLGLTYSIVSGPAHGTLGPGLPSQPGSVTYTPATGYSGTDSFTYTASDSEATANTATATVTVGAAPTQIDTARLRNQQITLETRSASACLPASQTLAAALSVVATAAGKHAARLTFKSAGFYIDGGIAHTKHVRRHGHRKTITTHAANVTAYALPATEQLPLSGLASGSHRLKVVLTYTARKHGHKQPLTQTLIATFFVC